MTRYLVEIDRHGRYAGLSSDSGFWQWNHTGYDPETKKIVHIDVYDPSPNDHNADVVREVPPEIMEEYLLLKKQLAEDISEKKRLFMIAEEERKQKEFETLISTDADDLGISNPEILKYLYKAHSTEAYKECVKLAKSFLTGKLKNDFKISLARQIIEWLHDADQRDKWKFPLSPKQLNVLLTNRNFTPKGRYQR